MSATKLLSGCLHQYPTNIFGSFLAENGLIYVAFISIVCYVITCEYANNQKLNPNYEKKIRWAITRT